MVFDLCSVTLNTQNRQNASVAIYRRYQQAGKTAKGKMLDAYIQTLALNRDYMAHILSNWGKTQHGVIGGKPVKFVAKTDGIR